MEVTTNPSNMHGAQRWRRPSDAAVTTHIKHSDTQRTAAMSVKIAARFRKSTFLRRSWSLGMRETFSSSPQVSSLVFVSNKAGTKKIKNKKKSKIWRLSITVARLMAWLKNNNTRKKKKKSKWTKMDTRPQPTPLILLDSEVLPLRPSHWWACRTFPHREIRSGPWPSWTGKCSHQ